MSLWTGMCRSTCLARAFAAYPETVLPPSLQFPIQMDETFECKEFCRASTRGHLENISVWKGLEWTLGSKMHAHLCIPVLLLQTEISQLSQPSWLAGKFPFLPLMFHGVSLLLHLQGRGPMEAANQGWGCRGCWVPTMLEEVRACAITAGGFWRRTPPKGC